jgi:hypothetical protein
MGLLVSTLQVIAVSPVDVFEDAQDMAIIECSLDDRRAEV